MSSRRISTRCGRLLPIAPKRWSCPVPPPSWPLSFSSCRARKLELMCNLPGQVAVRPRARAAGLEHEGRLTFKAGARQRGVSPDGLEHLDAVSGHCVLDALKHDAVMEIGRA